MPRRRLGKPVRLTRRNRIPTEMVEITDQVAWMRKTKIAPQLEAHDRLPPKIIHAMALADVPLEANHMLGLLKDGIAPERIIEAIKVEGVKIKNSPAPIMKRRGS